MKIAILDDYQQVALGMGGWERLPPQCKVVAFADHIADQDELVARLADFDIVCAMRERTPLPASVIARLPCLKLIVTAGVRNASIDVTAAAEREIPVCGTRRSGPAAAELALALLLALGRNLVEECNSVRSGGWQIGLGRDMAGAVLGVIGLGSLGSRVAAFGKALGMEVLAWSQNLTDERAAEVGVQRVEKAELLRRSDFVTIHLVLSQRTHGLIGAEEFALMKRDAALINTSRAAIVDTNALVSALEQKRIRAAAADVFDEEPLPVGDRLRNVRGLLATPHIGYVTKEVYEIFYTDFVEDILGFLNGNPVRVLTPS